MGIRILYVAEIVGKAGVFAVKKILPSVKRDMGIDFTIACADGATGGAGIGKTHSIYLRKLGIDVITMGEAAYYKRDIVEHFQKAPYLLRPLNYPRDNPGRGARIFDTGKGKVLVMCLLGQSGFSRVHLANPFRSFTDAYEHFKNETPFVIVDFHAATTAEKKTFFAYTDGAASAVIGSHTRVQTADACVTSKKTAIITDAGRTGSSLSVGGMDIESKIAKYTTAIPAWSKDAVGSIVFEGLVTELDDSGRAVSAEAIRIQCKEAMDDRTRDDYVDGRKDGESNARDA